MGKTILVVDDSPTLRLQLRSLLEGKGFDVLEAADGVLGLQTAKASNADLLIVDVEMPNMNGLEMIAEVRRLPKYKKMPIFVLTTEPRSQKERKESGAAAWIIKPFNSEFLLRAINKVLGL